MHHIVLDATRGADGSTERVNDDELGRQFMMSGTHKLPGMNMSRLPASINVVL